MRGREARARSASACVALLTAGVLTTIAACASLYGVSGDASSSDASTGEAGGDASNPTDGGAEDTSSSADAGSPDAGLECPPGAAELFDDGFDAPDRGTFPQGAWFSEDQETPGAVAILNGQLHVTAAALTDGGPSSNALFYKAKAPARRMCASFRVRLVAPTSFLQFQASGATALVFFGAKGSTSSWYHGLGIDHTGPYVYWTKSAGNGAGQVVTLSDGGSNVRIDVDYTTGEARIDVDGQSKLFSGSWDLDAGMPTPGVTMGAVQESPPTPQVEVFYDDVHLRLYH
jgi:hypothetical protein